MCNNTGNNISISSFLLLLILIAASCSVTKPAANDPKDLSYIYNPLLNPINPEFRVYNETAGNSILSVKLRAGDLFFSEANPSGEPLASLTITVRLYNDTQGGVLSDTAFLRQELNRKLILPEVVLDIPLRTNEDIEYTAEVRIMDNLNRRIVQTFVKFDRLSPYSRYSFKVRNHLDGTDVFSPVLTTDQYVNLLYPGKAVDTMYIFYFRYFDYVPYPPSMMLPERTMPGEPERMLKIPWSDTLPVMFPGKGIFLCSIDSNNIEGYTFLNFGSEYPGLSRPETMIEPLAYIATPDEMNAMRSAEKAKIAVDEFWLSRSTNIERSRELLRIYYNRVQFANYYFTSYKEGWRTDRGMIYIIYGPPDKVYKNREGEQWGYKKPVIKKSWGMRYRVQEEYLWFNFRRNPNRFTSEDYYLNRSDATPTFWDNAVADWRKGIVFRLDNPQDF
ncbi:MAG: GWxTD domain-containing protein [Bacteroidales bacterium]|jgi:GWxTD domain-containing protein|nr:GWxTD domain-containing protein [Bacteroidales bacterium]